MKTIKQSTFDSLDTKALWQKDKQHHSHPWTDLHYVAGQRSIK